MDNGGVVSVSGNHCTRGEAYAQVECVSPVRVLTSSVVAEGLNLKMVSVKTDRPIPKNRIFDAVEAIRNFRLTAPVECGDILIENFLGLNVHLVATRRASYLS